MTPLPVFVRPARVIPQAAVTGLLASFGQWIVTGEGIEAPGEGYELSPQDLWRMNWPAHMARKSWVDMTSFTAAFYFARKHFVSHRPEGLTDDFLTDYA